MTIILQKNSTCFFHILYSHLDSGLAPTSKHFLLIYMKVADSAEKNNLEMFLMMVNILSSGLEDSVVLEDNFH